ncbi:hypothetical protein D9619_007371 [Psilocybe cf. subviscida]|uniref:Carbohydrate esterase family 16 protein n=1 Tax=Psilocybe cf. subviscida TaxID=2480587 RepID=A0A8H5EWN6_9AGAR|nr:hypothetical protein D9619_007371 [Psilocybe cf. subviscida]
MLGSKSLLSLALCAILATRTLSASLSQHGTDLKPLFNWDSITYVHAFGDSYSFVQGTQGQANFRRAFKATTAFHLALALIVKIQQLHWECPRFCVYPTTGFAERNYTKKYKLGRIELGCFRGQPAKCGKQLWNFAFAGADIDGTLLPLHHNFTIPLVDQVKQWLTYAADIIPHPAEETLTTWWIGINDTGDTVTNATISDFNAFWNVEMASYFSAVVRQTLFSQAATNRGLRTHLFINVPPEERSPGSINSPTKSALLKEHITEFNTVLAAHISAFESANPDTRVMTFDAHSWFNSVLDNPRSFGFTNTTGYVAIFIHFPLVEDPYQSRVPQHHSARLPFLYIRLWLTTEANSSYRSRYQILYLSPTHRILLVQHWTSH